MTLAETLRQRCLLSVSLCNVGRDFSSIPDLCSYCLNFLVQCDTVADIICALNQNGFSLHRISWHETILVGNCCM